MRISKLSSLDKLPVKRYFYQLRFRIADVIQTQIIICSESENEGTISVRILLTGVGCVGKSTVGGMLSELLDVPFFDLDEEIEYFFETSVEQLQSRFLTTPIPRRGSNSTRASAEIGTSVIALPPSGLMGGYLRAIKNSFGVTVALCDKPENSPMSAACVFKVSFIHGIFKLL